MGCREKKLSKNLTQTFMAYCNVMICQQAALSGEAERPKVADAVIEAGADTFDWQARRKVLPGSDAGPLKRGAGFSFMMFRAGVGPSSAIVHVDARQRYTLFLGVTDVGPGAKTTMG